MSIARAFNGLSKNLNLQLYTELKRQQSKFPVLSLVWYNCVVLDLLFSYSTLGSVVVIVMTKLDTKYNYTLSSWCAFRLD